MSRSSVSITHNLPSVPLPSRQQIVGSTIQASAITLANRFSPNNLDMAILSYFRPRLIWSSYDTTCWFGRKNDCMCRSLSRLRFWSHRSGNELIHSTSTFVTTHFCGHPSETQSLDLHLAHNLHPRRPPVTPPTPERRLISGDLSPTDFSNKIIAMAQLISDHSREYKVSAEAVQSLNHSWTLNREAETRGPVTSVGESASRRALCDGHDGLCRLRGEVWKFVDSGRGLNFDNCEWSEWFSLSLFFEQVLI